MSRFTVVWGPDAEGQLADIWLAANDRAGVTVAADMIDRELRENPLGVGTPVSEG